MKCTNYVLIFYFYFNTLVKYPMGFTPNKNDNLNHIWKKLNLGKT